MLVDGNSATTYAAQSSLEPDDSDAPVDHPLVKAFFAGFMDGVYVRNDTPWPT